MDEMKVPDVEYKGKCGEIFKLHRMLDEAGIQHEFIDESIDEKYYIPGSIDGTKYHIYYPSSDDFLRAISATTDTTDVACSVIEGCDTYGYEQDLLEIMGLLTSKEEEHGSFRGYLTAENVFERIKAAEERRKELFRHTAPTDTDYLVEEGS